LHLELSWVSLGRRHQALIETNLVAISGLWHPKFIEPAKKHLPYVLLSHIGRSLWITRKYFFEHAQIMSIAFSSLTTADGQRFVEECRAANKRILVWTVNQPHEMVEAVRWGVDAIITDVPAVWLELRAKLEKDYDSTVAQHGRLFLWTTWWYYSPVQVALDFVVRRYLEGTAGPLDQATLVSAAVAAA
jgi:phosphatidylglycerol phospholipase C